MKRPLLPAGFTAIDAATVLARWLLGALFIYMGCEKALDPDLFLKLLRQYHMVQSSLALNSIAMAVPWFEVFCGLLLLAGIAVRGAALLLAGMLAVFTAVVFHRALGVQAAQAIPFCAVKFDCGCGGGPEFICAKLPENIGMFLLAVWLLAGRGRALCALYTWPSRPAHAAHSEACQFHCVILNRYHCLAHMILLILIINLNLHPTMRILSGIQPSGALHLGNYFGMMKPALELQEQGEAFYFIANYHSMTSLFDPAQRRQNTLDVALDFLACGLDPAKTLLFRQSDIPAVTELAWMLTTVTPMGLLERCHSYKEKLARGISPNHGIFAYPVLMAADILIYDSNVVPVGRDQKQHVEVTRDIAIKFNEAYGQTFVVPEPRIRDETAIVPGCDGQKMSKSYGNTIEIFGGEKAQRKKIMSLVMDSRSPREPKPDAEKNLAIQLLKLVAPPAVAADFEDRLRAGGLGYGDLKKALFEHYWNYFASARTRRAELAANLEFVEKVLRDSALKAGAVAGKVLHRARLACGLE